MSENLLCQIPSYFKEIEEAKAKALSLGQFKLNSLSSLCRFRLGTKRSEYKCYNCDAIDRLADTDGSLIDKPFNIRYKELQCTYSNLIVNESKMTTEEIEKYALDKWTVEEAMKKRGISVVNKLYTPFKCDYSLYTLKESVEPYELKDDVKDYKGLVDQVLAIWYNLSLESIYLRDADFILSSEPTAYSFPLSLLLLPKEKKEVKKEEKKEVKVKASFTVGIDNPVISKEDNYSIYELLFNLFKKFPKLHTYYFSLWVSLWPDYKYVKGLKEFKEIGDEKIYLRKDIYVNLYS
jgi:hypothetical protein